MPPFEGGVGRCVHIPPMKFSVKRCSLVPQLCYTVFMGSTKHVTIRIPEVFVRQAERVALRDDRSVSWVLQSWMQAGFTYLECCVHPSDSIEPKPTNGNVGLNVVMDKEKRNGDKNGVGDFGRGQVDGAVRAGLAGGGQGKRLEGDREARKGGAGNLTVRGPDTAGDAPVSSTNCPSCGGMNGLHQRGCKG